MREMDQLCTSGGSDNGKSLAAGDEPAMRVRGEVEVQAAEEEAAGGGCFDCNICLDFAMEPVITRCGHLYCWPCIYEWLHPSGDDGSADESNGVASSTRRPPCPVCKAAVSPDTLVPLYGRGGGSSKKARSGSAIPRRPTVHREPVERQSDRRSDDGGGGGGHQHGSTGPSSPVRSPWRANHHAAAASAPARFDVVYPPPPAAVGGVSMFHSTTTTGGMLGGMALAVLPWVSRGQAPPATASAYYTSPYHMSPRLRRQHMEVERSLHQLWFFLVVFAVLCLLLF